MKKLKEQSEDLFVKPDTIKAKRIEETMKNKEDFLTKIQKALLLVSDWRGFNFIKSKDGLLIIFSIRNNIGYKQFQFIRSYVSSFKKNNILMTELDYDKRTAKLFKLDAKDKIHIKIKINDLNDSNSKEFIRSLLDLSTIYYPENSL